LYVSCIEKLVRVLCQRSFLSLTSARSIANSRFAGTRGRIDVIRGRSSCFCL
jgi:hypothetical protein